MPFLHIAQSTIHSFTCHPSIHPSSHPSMHPFTHSSIQPFIHLSLQQTLFDYFHPPSISSPTHPPIHQLIYSSNYLPSTIHSSTHHPSIHPSNITSFHPPLTHLSNSPLIHPSIYQPVSVSTHPSIHFLFAATPSSTQYTKSTEDVNLIATSEDDVFVSYFSILHTLSSALTAIHASPQQTNRRKRPIKAANISRNIAKFNKSLDIAANLISFATDDRQDSESRTDAVALSYVPSTCRQKLSVFCASACLREEIARICGHT